MHMIFMEDYMLATAVSFNFAKAFPCTAHSAPSAGRAAHHLTAYKAQHGYEEVRDSLNEPEYSMNEEGNGPNNRARRLARHPTSYEAQLMRIRHGPGQTQRVGIQHE
jgi:hypothetical protein